MAMTDDTARVSELLGRPPRCRFEVVVRDGTGDPVVIRNTPVLSSRMLTERAGVTVALKAENLQRTGSFKLRGAVAKIASLGDACAAAGVWVEEVVRLLEQANSNRLTPSRATRRRAYSRERSPG